MRLKYWIIFVSKLGKASPAQRQLRGVGQHLLPLIKLCSSVSPTSWERSDMFPVPPLLTTSVREEDYIINIINICVKAQNFIFPRRSAAGRVFHSAGAVQEQWNPDYLIPEMAK